MDRRGFLRGMLIGATATASTALVKLASPDEVRALEIGQPALLGQPKPVPLMPIWPDDGLVYVQLRGKFEPIGYLTRVELETPINEAMRVTGDVVMVPGLRRANASFSSDGR